MSVYDTGGNGTFAEEIVDVAGELKLGNFRLSFTDLEVPVTGIPITLTRTYDTLTSNDTDDFGYGWRMEFRDTDLRTSLGKPSEEDEILGRLPAFKDDTRVYITLPGGKREGFTFKPSIDPVSKFLRGAASSAGADGYDPNIYRPEFEADDGVTSTLTVKDERIIRNNGTSEFFGISGSGYNPADSLFGSTYILTTKEGIEYEIDGNSGDLLSVTDTNGNTLTYTDEAVTSSTGQKITFARDAEGRITSVKDPEGELVKYEYDDNGDLVSVTDREENVTRMEYNPEREHYLDKIIDPLGRTGARNEYGEDGRLKKIFDANGNPVELDFDPENSIQTVKDALGNPTTYEYDERGNIVTEIDAVGKITKRRYNDNNNVEVETVITDETGPAGYVTTYTYDSEGNQLTEEDPLGNITRYTYNSLGQALTRTNPLGHTTTYNYDRRGNLQSIKDAEGNSASFSYDFEGNLKSITEGENDITRFEYDDNGNRILEVDALGNETEFKYDDNGNVAQQITKLTTPEGVRTLVATKTYDNEGRITSLLDAENNLTQYEYDANGNQAAIIDSLNRRTEYSYDENNKITQTVFPDDTPDNPLDNLRTKVEYNAVGNQTSITDTANRITQPKYDALNRVTEIIYPDTTPDNLLDNPRINNEYNQLGQIIASTDNRGIRTEYEYDAAGRRTVIRNKYQGNDVENKTEYDAAGRVIAETNALNHTTKYVYDALDRVIETIFADGTKVKTSYDAFGNVVTQTDQEGRTTSHEYDALDQLKAVVDAKNNRIEYDYDEAGNLIHQKDANSHITRFEYDGLGNRKATERPLGQRSVAVYDEASKIISATDFNGDTITYEYDKLDRLITKNFVDEGTKVEVTYAKSGKPETYKDERGTTTYTYNEQDQLLSRTEPDGTTITYTYNQKGQIETVTTSNNTVGYTYDEWGRLDTVTSQEGVTDYDFDIVGNLITTEFANNVVEERSYDDLNRLIGVTNTDADSNILSSYTYTLDKVGHRTVIEELNGRKVEYDYDELYRLIEETITDPINSNHLISYGYDNVGNRLTRNDSVGGITTYIYDDNDRLQSETIAGLETIYGYDNNGNVISVVNPQQQVNYDWNSENRLIAATTIDSTGNHNIQYQYDANGVRVASIVDGEETRYLIDANRYYPQVLEEYKPTGEVIKNYTYGSSLLSLSQDNESSFYLYDGYSGVRQVSNELGEITDTYSYDAYGRLLNSTGTTENDYLYQGEQFDSNLDLQYLRARYYDPNTGRFVSVDPVEGSLEQPMSRHRYIYGNDNPVTYIDPSGESALLALNDVWFTTINTLMTTLSSAAVLGRVVSIATGLAATAGAISTAAIAYSYWRRRSEGGIRWTGDFNLAKIPSYGALPGSPSAAFGLAQLQSQGDAGEFVDVSATGLSYSLLPPVLPKFPVPLPTYSTYKVDLKGPNIAKAISTPGASNRGALFGPFIFSTLKFTWPYILPEAWEFRNVTDGVLQFGFGIGTVTKASRIADGSFYDGTTFSPLDASFAIGLSVPGK
ncbi:MAG: RHS repeat-associated core domain-containing protein [Rivularia sp. (in: cyanobacteria)]